jgi:hypothetical protein
MTDVLVIVAGCMLLIIFGGLIGTSLDEHLNSDRARRQAMLQRRLNEQWRALQAEHGRQPGVCPICGRPCEPPADEEPAP